MRLSRLQIALVVWLTAVGPAVALEKGPTPVPARPNFIVFVADDVGWDDIGAFGHPTLRTPNIDGLARSGMRFDRAFLTTSTCSPIRCSILTGRYPHSTGAPDAHDPLPENQTTFVEKLRAAGYFTASVGKWHIGDPAATRFDRVKRAIGGMSGCESWLETLREVPPGKPFLLWLASLDAHRPYAKRTIPTPYRLEDVVVPPFIPDLLETRIDFTRYYEEITRLDDYVGLVLVDLDRQRLANDTVVFFLSDNGRPFPRCKLRLYDSGLKTPLIVRHPGVVQAGSVCGGLVSSVDIAPTLLELAGIPVPSPMQGVSFVPLLKDPKARGREQVFAEHNWHDYPARERAVRDRRYKYIRNFYHDLPNTPPADVVQTPMYQAMRRLRDQGRLPPAQMDYFVQPRPAEELFDVEADPHEMKNLAASPSHAAALKRLREALAGWQRETADLEPARRRPAEYDRETGRQLPKANRHQPAH